MTTVPAGRRGRGAAGPTRSWPAPAHTERLRELASIGCDQFAAYLMHDDEDATLDAYGSQIIPALIR